MRSYPFLLVDGWHVLWHGQIAKPLFNSRGAALAYLATCDAAGRLRS